MYGFHRRPVPSGWQFCIHPEGCIYYLRESVASDEDPLKIRIITQADLAHDGAAKMIEDLAKRVYNDARHYPSFPREVDLVLELVDVGNTIEAGYYFVHHKNRCLFWLEEFDGTVILRECSGVTELSHKRQLLCDSLPFIYLIKICRNRTRGSILVCALESCEYTQC